MMIKRFDCDRQWRDLRLDMGSRGEDGLFGAIPRKSVYGSAPGLIPFGEAYPDKLVDPKDYKEVIQFCHDQKIFPMYHQKATWGPDGFRWNQNGLGYCWTWSGTGDVMNCRALEGKPSVLLSPVSMGWLVGWRNRGNYLESFINGAMERGIAPMEYTPDQHSLNYKKFKEGWEDAALNYRIQEAWDSDARKMIQHAISILRCGVSGYIAYNWWGHALSLVGVRWDESVLNNIVWIIRNSHDEDDFIELTGSRGVPDELYGIRSTRTLLAA